MDIDKLIDSVESSDIAIKEKDNLTLTKQLRYYIDQWGTTRDKVRYLERIIGSLEKTFICECGMKYKYFFGKDSLSTNCDKCNRLIEVSCIKQSFDMHYDQ